MRQKVTECKVCFSSEIVKVTTKDTNKKLAICRECQQIYELDENGNIIFHHDPKDVEYFNLLDKTFGTWDNVKDITPYNEEEGET